jgi:hypothetical protein
MSEEVLSGRNGNALDTHGSAPAAHTATHAAARGVRRMTNTEVVCEVLAW